MAKFTRVSDEELRENGFEPEWILPTYEDEEGPYAIYRDPNGACPCCGSRDTEWDVVDLSTATAVGAGWYGDNAECNAHEHAGALNRSWLLGYNAAKTQIGSGGNAIGEVER